MRLLFVSQEFACPTSGGAGIVRPPSGVISVLTELCRGWPGSDRILVLLNHGHWAEQYLRDELDHRAGFDVFRVPVFLSTAWLIQYLAPLPRVVRLALRFLCMPVTMLQSCLLLFWLAFLLRYYHIDGVLSHNGGWPGGMLNRWVIYAAYLAGVPRRVLVIHNMPHVPVSWFGRILFDISVWLMDWMATRVITVSQACRHSLELVCSFAEKTDVIYNGILIGVKQLDVDAPWNKRYLSVAFIGHLIPDKGVHVLLEAVMRLPTPCELILVGNGDNAYTAELQRSAENSPWPVHFLGLRDDMLNIYPKLDLVVLPSLDFESFGMVLVEGMRAGIPTICSDFGGMKEVVIDGETGLIVPAGSVDALAFAIDRLLQDEPLRKQMGQLGQRRVEDLFDSKLMVARYVNVLHADV